jgi:hypothetical protein
MVLTAIRFYDPAGHVFGKQNYDKNMISEVYPGGIFDQPHENMHKITQFQISMGQTMQLTTVLPFFVTGAFIKKYQHFAFYQRILGQMIPE